MLHVSLSRLAGTVVVSLGLMGAASVVASKAEAGFAITIGSGHGYDRGHWRERPRHGYRPAYRDYGHRPRHAYRPDYAYRPVRCTVQRQWVQTYYGPELRRVRVCD